MLLRLLGPALAPSWRFFDSVGPSPRIEFARLGEAAAAPADWAEFRPRPAFVSLAQMLRRLFWNPARNESLFLTSCAERLLEAPTEHSRGEITARIAADCGGGPGELQFRIVVVTRGAAGLQRRVEYVSPPFGGAGAA